jgi:hypothetical protein
MEDRRPSRYVDAVVPKSLRSTWIALLLATVAVVATGSLIVRNFVRDVFVDCRGTLKQVPESELGPSPDLVPIVDLARERVPMDLEIKFDEKSIKSSSAPQYENVRVVWNRADSACACSDVRLRWRNPAESPWHAELRRDRVTGLYVVQGPRMRGLGDETLAVFRKVEDSGHRLQPGRVLSPKHVSMLVFLLALGALGVAAYRATRATPYATRMHGWRVATLRPDGLVESESGATLGTLENGTRIAAGSVLVDPRALEGRDVYREMPILGRKHVASGTHERWYEGTMRRLRDARSLAVITTVTTALALGAHVLGG